MISLSILIFLVGLWVVVTLNQIKYDFINEIETVRASFVLPWPYPFPSRCQAY